MSAWFGVVVEGCRRRASTGESLTTKRARRRGLSPSAAFARGPRPGLREDHESALRRWQRGAGKGAGAVCAGRWGRGEETKNLIEMLEVIETSSRGLSAQESARAFALPARRSGPRPRAYRVDTEEERADCMVGVAGRGGERRGVFELEEV